MNRGDIFWIVAAGVVVSIGTYVHMTIGSSENNQQDLVARGGKASSRKNRRSKTSNNKTRHR